MHLYRDCAYIATGLYINPAYKFQNFILTVHFILGSYSLSHVEDVEDLFLDRVKSKCSSEIVSFSLEIHR